MQTENNKQSTIDDSMMWVGDTNLVSSFVFSNLWDEWNELQIVLFYCVIARYLVVCFETILKLGVLVLSSSPSAIQCLIIPPMLEFAIECVFRCAIQCNAKCISDAMSIRLGQMAFSFGIRRTVFREHEEWNSEKKFQKSRCDHSRSAGPKARLWLTLTKIFTPKSKPKMSAWNGDFPNTVFDRQRIQKS